MKIKDEQLNSQSEKLPKILHFGFSPNLQNDDRKLPDDNIFVGKSIVVELKIDGECTGMTRETCHARSIDGRSHPSRDWVRRLHGNICHMIPKNFRLYGENAFAAHSIFYSNLPSYFFLFLIVDDKNICLSWEETEEWAKLLDLHTAPYLYHGKWDIDAVKACQHDHCPMGWGDSQEGYVVRNADAFPWDEFQNNYAKFVRKGHVQTTDHWLKHWVPNKLQK